MAARLADAVIAGDDDIDTLRALALALAEVSAMPPARAEIDPIVRTTVLAKLRELYAPVAQATNSSGTCPCTRISAAWRLWRLRSSGVLFHCRWQSRSKSTKVPSVSTSRVNLV